jgi:integrase
MSRKAKGLSAAKVRTAKPGRYGDGNGLYLFVKPNGSRFWLFRYVRQDHMREMGLGRAGADPGAVPLAEAREKAGELMRLVRSGVDPLAQREADAAAAKAEAQQAAVRGITFRTVTGKCIEAHEAAWRNPKHRAQWRNTLDTYAMPHFGDVPVAEVTTAHVLAALEPIWRTKAETATRVRGRIEAVLDYATALKWREGENPAHWRGHLSNLLPARRKVAPVEHHAALPWREAGSFMTALRKQAGVSAQALEFTILTAARSGEVLGATWGEIDLRVKIWTVAAPRMKAGKEHRVPLAEPALAVLAEMAKQRLTDDPDTYVFPGGKPGKSLSVMALAMVLRRMERGDLTVHGFRSSFRDWCAEATSYQREVAEAALAHTLGDKTEAAYQRGDMLAKRAQLMAAWATFCARPMAEGGSVTPIRAAG